MSVYIALNVKKTVHNEPGRRQVAADTDAFPIPMLTTVEYAFDDYWEKKRRQEEYFSKFEERKLREEERFQEQS